MSPARYSRGCPKVWAVRHSAASKVKGVRGWDQQWSPCLPAEMLSLSFTVPAASCSLVPLKASCMAAACHITR